MNFVSRFRDWLLANDPAFSRLRQASRITVTIVLSVTILFAIHIWIAALPPAAYSLAVVLSIQGGLSVRDTTAREQMKTRLIGCVVSVAVTCLAAALESHRYLSDFAFLAVIFAAAYGRGYGQRGFAIGMFAVMSYFMGAYLQPTLAQVPHVAAGAVVSAVMAHYVRVMLFPDDWRRDLLQSLESVLARVDYILAALGDRDRTGAWSDADHAELLRLEDRLKEAVLMADSFVPVSMADPLPETMQPSATIALRLFDLHLAAESAIVVSLQSPPYPDLVRAVMRGEERIMARPSVSHDTDDDRGRAETIHALLWLRDARSALTDSMALGRSTHFAGFDRPGDRPGGWSAPRLSLQDPAIRSAIQITLACGIAMVFGLMLSRERWFWAVLTTFLVFTNTSSRGDTAVKALQRSVGTLFGIGIGMVLAVLLSGHPAGAILISILCIFLAFYALQVSYAAMTFFITIVICLVYGMTGMLTLDVLKLRVGETLIGAIAGTGVAFFVLPVRTQSTLDTALAKWFDALRSLLAAAQTQDEVSHADMIDLSRRVDSAYRDVTTAAKPLGVSWQIVTRPGHIRQTLAILMACTYWARIFASRMTFSGVEIDDEVRARLREAIARLDAVAPKGAACFYVRRRASAMGARHLPLSRKGSRLGIAMIVATLDRLYPQSAA